MIRNLAVLAYAQGFTHWHYRADNITEILSNPTKSLAFCSDLRSPMDIIIVTAPNGKAEIFIGPDNTPYITSYFLVPDGK